MLLLTFITLFLEHRDVGWGHTRRVVGVKITDGVIASKEVQISGDDDIKGDISPLIVKAVTGQYFLRFVFVLAYAFHF